MDVSSQSGSTKRPRVKTATKAPAAPKAERKPLSAKKKAAAPEPVVLEMLPEPPMDLTGTIATAAFYLAAERNFAPGHELDDWLEAERRIRGIP
jgi:hypothetical protein